MQPKQDEKTYVLVVAIKWTYPDLKHRPVAYGPFHTRDAVEYAAMDYYGTAITGASANDEFLIAELRSATDPDVRPKKQDDEELP